MAGKIRALMLSPVMAGLVLSWAAPSNAGHLGFEASCSPSGSDLLCTWDAPLPDPDADGNVAGRALFSLSGNTLSIELATLAPADGNVVDKQIEVLTGITFDWSLGLASDAGIDAMIFGSSVLVGNPNPDPGLRNVSAYWAFGPLDDPVWGDFGFAAIGGESPYCTGECFGSMDMLDGIVGPNGSDYGLVPMGAGVEFSNSLNGGGPYVQYQLTLTATVSGGNGYDLEQLIGHVVPIYGTDGTPPIPEPSAAVLFGAGALIVGFALRKQLF